MSIHNMIYHIYIHTCVCVHQPIKCIGICLEPTVLWQMSKCFFDSKKNSPVFNLSGIVLRWVVRCQVKVAYTRWREPVSSHTVPGSPLERRGTSCWSPKQHLFSLVSMRFYLLLLNQGKATSRVQLVFFRLRGAVTQLNPHLHCLWWWLKFKAIGHSNREH